MFGVVNVPVFDLVGFWFEPSNCQLVSAVLVLPLVPHIQAFEA